MVDVKLLRQYVPNDYPELQKLFKTWDLKAPEKAFLPNMGYIVDGVAAGFLYFTDSKIAIIDNFISNKQSSRQDRDKALDEIVEALLASARTGGAKLVKCDTDIDAIKKRAVKMGFNTVGIYTSFARMI